MKLDTLRNEWAYRLSHEEFRVPPELIEDTIWFLNLLRRTQGYNVERPTTYQERKRWDYEDPFRGQEASWKDFKNQYEQAEETIRKARRAWEESVFNSFYYGGFEKNSWRQQQYQSNQSNQQSSKSENKRPWYEVLGVRPDATIPQRTKAYRSLAQRWHPDKPGGSHEKMAELNQAKKEAGL